MFHTSSGSLVAKHRLTDWQSPDLASRWSAVFPVVFSKKWYPSSSSISGTFSRWWIFSPPQVMCSLRRDILDLLKIWCKIMIQLTIICEWIAKFVTVKNSKNLNKLCYWVLLHPSLLFWSCAKKLHHDNNLCNMELRIPILGSHFYKLGCDNYVCHEMPKIQIIWGFFKFPE